jgi:hypothetical protein
VLIDARVGSLTTHPAAADCAHTRVSAATRPHEQQQLWRSLHGGGEVCAVWAARGGRRHDAAEVLTLQGRLLLHARCVWVLTLTLVRPASSRRWSRLAAGAAGLRRRSPLAEEGKGPLGDAEHSHTSPLALRTQHSALGWALARAEHQHEHWPQHRATCSAVPQTSAACAPITATHPAVDVVAACASLGRMELGAGGDAGGVASRAGGAAASPRRVCMIAPGSRGDVMPLVAVGTQLQRLGCRCAAPVPPGPPPVTL